jgi:putative ABC transport system permease protein
MPMNSVKSGKNRTYQPPLWARWLISRLSLYEDRHSILGDFEEIYNNIAMQQGIIRARFWYSLQALRSGLAYLPLVGRIALDLLGNYAKVAMRSLRRYKTYAVINILGLAIGLAAVVLITLYIAFELNFDRHNKNARCIHRIVCEDYVGIPYILGDTLKAQVPGIEEVARLKHLTDNGPIMLTAGNRKYMEKALYMADASLFKVFSFKFLCGNPETALLDPNSVVLTKSAARRYFGRDDPLGEILLHGDDLSLQITAVVADLPSASHFHFNAVIPTAQAARFSWGIDDRTSWTSYNYLTYILLHPYASTTEILQKASELANSHLEKTQVLRMQRLLDIHLNSHLRGELEENGDKNYLRIYAAVGVIILLMACINFMNLGSAHSFSRSGEVGIRKVMGAQRTQIIRQFIGEAVLIALLSAVLASILAQITLPFFRQLSGIELSWGSVPWALLVPVLFIIVIFAGMVAGSYPAFYASSFQPVRTLRNAPKIYTQRFPLRNLLVGFQFVVSILLIGCTLFIFNQMHYLKTRKLGIDQSRIITIRLPDESLGESEAVKAELLRHSAIIKATGSSFLPSVTQNRIRSTWEGRMETEDIYLWRISVDDDFISTFGIEIIEGEEFQDKHTPGGTYIVNQSAAELIGGQVVGKTFRMSSGASSPGKIVGVVRDFNFRSLHHAIEPMVLFLDAVRTFESRGQEYKHAPFRYISVKAVGNDLKGAIRHVRDVCRDFVPDDPDCWFFFDEEFGRMYMSEQKTAGVMVALSLIAVALAGMGLLGLSLYAVARRRKEMGIRRVLGASVPSVLFLFFRDFLYIHAAAMLFGFPLIYWAMNRWLSNFAYRIAIGPWLFVATAVLTAAFFFIIGSSSVIKAVAAPPVDSLRYE